MDEGCLVFTLQVMQNSQDQTNCLDIGVRFLLSKQVEKGQDEDGSQIFNVEHHFPSNLLSQILDSEGVGGQFGNFEWHLIVREDMLDFAILIGELLLQDWHFGLFFDLLFDPLDGAGLVGHNGELLVLVIDGQVQRHIFNIN